MQELYLEDSPIAYYIDDAANKDWIVFIHAAFVDRRMFEKQFEYFSGKYNLLAVDILGHGNSLRARKGDTVEKMSYWIDRIFQKHGISAAHFVGVSLGSVFIQDLPTSTRIKFCRFHASADMTSIISTKKSKGRIPRGR